MSEIKFNPKQVFAIKNIGPEKETAFPMPADMLEQVRQSVGYQQFKFEFDVILWLLGHPGVNPKDLVIEVQAPFPGKPDHQVLKGPNGEVIAVMAELKVKVSE